MDAEERESKSIDRMVTILDLLGQPTRLRIVLTLNTNGPMHVKALSILRGESQAVVSHHLIKMKDRKLTTSHRKGVLMLYSLIRTYWSDQLEVLISR
jgi:DNA-binding transcriptional ArsR family regulator